MLHNIELKPADYLELVARTDIEVYAVDIQRPPKPRYRVLYADGQPENHTLEVEPGVQVRLL